MKRLSYAEIPVAMNRRVDFDGNSMSGRWLTHMPYTGQLGYEDSRRLRSDFLLAEMKGKPVYVITSYSTPIAWMINESWYVVTHKFSQTTSRHQGHCRAVAGLPWSHKNAPLKEINGETHWLLAA